MMDFVLESWMSALIERAKMGWMLGFGHAWRPGERLKLLLASYNGARNTGSDLRVEEMIRQIQRVLGPENVEISVTTQDFDFSRGYFGDAIQVKLPDVFPPFLYRQVSRHHGVMACEGSMFKSKWANALTTMMIGAMGLAAAQNKLSIGYGGDADRMDPMVAWMCRRYCRQSLLIARTQGSQATLRDQGITAELGTDTAWTFDPAPPEYARNELRAAGWDGVMPVMVVCASDPFCWPVKPSLAKYTARMLTGAYKESQYRTIYFHKSGRDVDAALDRFLTGYSAAVNAFRKQNDVFVIVVAMERLDKKACQRVADLLGGVPVFASDRYDMFQLVSILRQGHLMVSSRYHAIVTSMPALVPSAGVAIDERVHNLMHQRGHENLLVSVDDPDLQAKVLVALNRLQTQRDAIRDAIGRTVVENLKLMARMGVLLEQNVRERYPEFPGATGIRNWEDYLPPLNALLAQLVEKYETHARVASAS